MKSMSQDEKWMRRALTHAQRAAQEGEVPVGCVIVREGKVVGWGRNRREGRKNALAHAEIEAIARACKKLGGWRLPGCTLYVTLEPCPMCAGAIVNARIGRVCFGAPDPKAGACGSVLSLFDYPLNHRPEWTGGVCQEECARQLREFFRVLRQQKRTKCDQNAHNPAGNA